MALFTEIDKEKTKQQVKDLLSLYRTFIRLASEEYIPKVTATYSFELKSFTGVASRATENAVVRKVTAALALNFFEESNLVNKVTRMDYILYISGYISFNGISDESKGKLVQWINEVDFSNKSNSERRKIFSELINLK